MEYNPTRKDELKHREYLKKVCKFQNVLNVDELISERITELYRMQVCKEENYWFLRMLPFFALIKPGLSVCTGVSSSCAEYVWSR